jgi:hypothetical protein
VQRAAHRVADICDARRERSQEGAELARPHRTMPARPVEIDRAVGRRITRGWSRGQASAQ